MAVSHQWFIQWSAPSMIFADITSNYNNVNTNVDRKIGDSEFAQNDEKYKFPREQLQFDNQNVTEKPSSSGELINIVINPTNIINAKVCVIVYNNVSALLTDEIRYINNLGSF